MALKSFQNKIIPNQLVHDHVILFLGLLEVLQDSHITTTLYKQILYIYIISETRL